MLLLKEYQQRTLEALKLYFEECSKSGNASTAYYETTKVTLGTGLQYFPVKELPGLPYVCIRIPTGGGKTLVASHAVGIATKYLLQADVSTVLWLVPSNAIREQTLKALKNHKHPYRQALETLSSDISILDVKEALFVQRSSLDNETTVIVSTMQAFRVEDIEGRKVYEPSGSLMGHFTGLPEEILYMLEHNGKNQPIPSLANVLRLRRPIIIVDEAHNARTDLSFETLARFNPSCIIEFTATPDRESNPSNVLYSVSAAELKAEEMIKLPIWLETKYQWKELLSDAVSARSHLEDLSRKERYQTNEYIRPIMLIQAQPNRKNRDSLTVEVIKRCLMEDHKIPEEQIAIATGDQKELEGIDILDQDCKICFVITIQALKEGWDCPFAYVLYSVAELSSSTAIEQILGRILRLPRAKLKKNRELNMAYAFVASQNFFHVANTLTDALVQNGFERQEAKDLISKVPGVQLNFQGKSEQIFSDTITVTVTERPKIETLPKEILSKIDYNDILGTFTINGRLNEQEKEKIKECFSSPENKEKIENVVNKFQHSIKAPSEQLEIFSVPLLSIKQGTIFEPFEETHFLEIPWYLSKCDPVLTEDEFPSQVQEGQYGEITVTNNGHIETRFLSTLHRQMKLLTSDQGWDIPSLVNWLDQTISHPDITPEECGIFLTNLVLYLIEERKLELSYLIKEKYRLRKAVSNKIELHRKNARKQNYQLVLFSENALPLSVTPEISFSFNPNQYPYSMRYKGNYRFKKHYYPEIGDLEDKGEEFECAQYIDSLPEVKYWVRNIDRRPNHSFWLQTSTDKFYPDFVCLLNDDRYLVVEHKGEDRWSTDDSKEKRALGNLWELRSNGKCLFIMTKGKNFNVIKVKIQNAS